jgi:hypothetical protein
MYQEHIFEYLNMYIDTYGPEEQSVDLLVESQRMSPEYMEQYKFTLV